MWRLGGASLVALCAATVGSCAVGSGSAPGEKVAPTSATGIVAPAQLPETVIGCATGYEYVADPRSEALTVGPVTILTEELTGATDRQRKVPIVLAAGRTAVISASDLSGASLPIAVNGLSNASVELSASCSKTSRVWPALFEVPPAGCLLISVTESGSTSRAEVPTGSRVKC